MLPLSTVNMVEKYLFKVSALSCGSHVILPSGSLIAPTLVLVFNLLLQYR